MCIRDSPGTALAAAVPAVVVRSGNVDARAAAAAAGDDHPVVQRATGRRGACTDANVGPAAATAGWAVSEPAAVETAVTAVHRVAALAADIDLHGGARRHGHGAVCRAAEPAAHGTGAALRAVDVK